MCQYTTTTVSNGKSTTSTAAACTSETGNIPANSSNATVTYSAPALSQTKRNSRACKSLSLLPQQPTLRQLANLPSLWTPASESP
jgi:hypothetical protein